MTAEYKNQKREFEAIEEQYKKEKVDFDRAVAGVKAELDKTL